MQLKTMALPGTIDGEKVIPVRDFKVLHGFGAVAEKEFLVHHLELPAAVPRPPAKAPGIIQGVLKRTAVVGGQTRQVMGTVLTHGEWHRDIVLRPGEEFEPPCRTCLAGQEGHQQSHSNTQHLSRFQRVKSSSAQRRQAVPVLGRPALHTKAALWQTLPVGASPRWAQVLLLICRYNRTGSSARAELVSKQTKAALPNDPPMHGEASNHEESHACEANSHQGPDSRHVCHCPRSPLVELAGLGNTCSV